MMAMQSADGSGKNTVFISDFPSLERLIIAIGSALTPNGSNPHDANEFAAKQNTEAGTSTALYFDAWKN
jgi:hypothetical protein